MPSQPVRLSQGDWPWELVSICARIIKNFWFFFFWCTKTVSSQKALTINNNNILSFWFILIIIVIIVHLLVTNDLMVWYTPTCRIHCFIWRSPQSKCFILLCWQITDLLKVKQLESSHEWLSMHAIHFLHSQSRPPPPPPPPAPSARTHTHSNTHTRARARSNAWSVLRSLLFTHCFLYYK